MRTTSSQPLPTVKPVSSVVGHNPVFAQCMLRITNPTTSKTFYELLGMTHLTRLDFPDFKFSLFFYAYLPPNTSSPPPQSDSQPDRARYLWSIPYPTIELTWNWPADTLEQSLAEAEAGNKGDEQYVNGNENPKGFGHISISVSDLPAALQKLETNGFPALDKPSPTLISDIATSTVIAPDGYHVEIKGPIPNSSPNVSTLKELDPVFKGVMLRVKDPRNTMEFFNRIGMEYLTRVENKKSEQTHYWMGYSRAEDRPLDRGNDEERGIWISKRRECLLELVHHWGTEEEKDQMYANGNVKPNRGFGHVGIIVDDIYESMDKLEKDGYKVVRKPSGFGNVGELGFIADPSTDYWVEIIKRSGTAADVPYEQPVIESST